MYTRFLFLGLLLEHPCSKLEAMKTLRITRPYLERILDDWSKLSLIEVRDVSPLAKPKMVVFLKLRPIMRIERLDGQSEVVSDIPGLMNLSRVLVSPAKARLLDLLSSRDRLTTASGKLMSSLSKVAGESKQALYQHLKDLLSSGLVMKISSRVDIPATPANEFEQGYFSTNERREPGIHPRSIFRVNFKSISLELQPYNYRS